MVNCAVANCGLSRWSGPPGLSFFSFPKNPVLRAEWLRRCASDVLDFKKARVCGNHFMEEDTDPSYLFKSIMMRGRTNPVLRAGAVPSVNIPAPSSTPGRRSQQLRRERQERKERKELVEQLLAEYDQNQQRQAAEREKQLTEPPPQVEVIELVKCGKRTRRLRKDAADRSLCDTVAVAAVEAAIVQEPEAENLQEPANLLTDENPPLPDDDDPLPPDDDHPPSPDDYDPPSADYDHPPPPDDDDPPPPDDDHPPSPDYDDPPPPDDDLPPVGDDGATLDGSDGGETASMTAGLAPTPAPAAAAAPRLVPARATDYAAYSRKVVKRSSISARERAKWKAPNTMVERTKEILRLKLRVRKLEAKCVQVLAVPDAPRPTTGGGDGEDRLADASGAPADGVELSTAGETPLVVLREGRGAKVPAILTQLRQHQLSNTMSTFTPSDLEEARQINHQLKVQLLTLQAAVLKFAIKKKMRDANLTEPGERRQRCMKTVASSRLRGLQQLETAVKAIFTESQIRAMVLEHGGATEETRKVFKVHWGDEDLRRVMELRAISSDQAVDHVREKMKIPLPSMHTTRKRCKKTPELKEAYTEMMQKSHDIQRRCGMCQRQVKTIDEVIEAADRPASDVYEGAPFLPQNVPAAGSGQDPPTTGLRKKKRRRPPAKSAPAAKRKKRPTPVLDRPETSDSDTELSDPGLWGPAQLAWLDSRPNVSDRRDQPTDQSDWRITRPPGLADPNGELQRSRR